MSFVATTFVGGASAIGTYTSAIENNKASNRAIENANRRYAMDSMVSINQMEEQNAIALEQMTEVTRKFLAAKGKAKAIQAETMVGGNVEKRLKADLRLKESETKGKIAKEVNTNIINIAQGMIANKIDNDALINEALAKKRTGLALVTDVSLSAMGGALTGYQAATAFKSANTKKVGN